MSLFYVLSFSEDDLYLNSTLILVLTIWSILCLVTVFLTYSINKTIQGTGTMLIAYMCLFEAIASFHLLFYLNNPRDLAKDYKLDELLHYVTFGITNLDRSRELICECSVFGYYIPYFVSIILNICYFIDIILLFKNPFYNGKSRNFAYVLCSICIPAIIVFSTRTFFKGFCRDPREDVHLILIEMILASFTLAGMIIAIYATIYSFYKLSTVHKHIKSSDKCFFYQKHILYLFLFIVLWISHIVSITMKLLLDTNKIKEYTGFFKYLFMASTIITLSTGMLLSGARLLEPCFISFVLAKIKQIFLKFFCCSKDTFEDLLKDVEEKLKNANINLVFLDLDLKVELMTRLFSALRMVLMVQPMEELLLTRRELELLCHSITTFKIAKVDESSTSSIYNINPVDSFHSDRMPSAVSDILKKEDSSSIAHFEVFAPLIFAYIRKMSKVENEELKKSFSLTDLHKKLSKNQDGGRSGSFIYFTSDNKFIMKMINESECNSLIHVLYKYYIYLSRFPKSFVCRLFGLYAVQLPGLKKVYFMLMENGIRANKKMKFLTFDLKGSEIDRFVKVDQSQMSSEILKDVNLIKLFRVHNPMYEGVINLSNSDKKSIFEIIANDANFFKRQQLMDYSLLFCIEAIEDPSKSTEEVKETSNTVYSNKKVSEDENYLTRVFYSQDRRFKYHFCIIDFLQEYTFGKKLEHIFKVLKSGKKNSNKISSIPPDDYAARFMIYMKEKLLVNNIISQ